MSISTGPPATVADEQAPAVDHRIITVLAAGSLVVAAEPVWRLLISQSATRGTAFGTVFPLLLAVVAVALGAKRRRSLIRLDLVLIVLALGSVLMRAVPILRRPSYVIDESVLMFRAIEAVAHGTNPYAGSWAADVARAPTLLLDGSNPGRFGYPPLTPLLGGGLAHVVGDSRAPVVLSLIGILLTAAVLLRLLPVSRRGLIVPATVTISALPFLSLSAFPTAIMVPLLIVACHRPASLGAGGALGRRGVLQAIALGLAAATQQLAWFVVPFLLVVVWRARRGELEPRPAALVVLRFAGVGAAAFAVVNAPFVIAGPRLWLRGITDPLLQHAMINGPGLPNLSLRIVGGSGQLAYWSAAAAVVFVTLLAVVALWPQLWSPGAVLVPFVALWVSMRAQTIYYVTALPIAVAAYQAKPQFTDALPLRLRRVPRLVVPVLGGLVAAAFVVAALVTPAPLAVRVTAVSTAPGTGALRSITLHLRNTSDHRVSPHVTVPDDAKFTPFLRQVSGLRSLRPGQSTTMVLVPPTIHPYMRGVRRVFIVSDDPQTLSSASVPRRRR